MHQLDLHHCNKIREVINFKKEKKFVLAQFWRSQSTVGCPHRFSAYGEAVHHGRRNCSPHGIQAAKRRFLKAYVPSDLMTSLWAPPPSKCQAGIKPWGDISDPDHSKMIYAKCVLNTVLGTQPQQRVSLSNNSQKILPTQSAHIKRQSEHEQPPYMAGDGPIHPGTLTHWMGRAELCCGYRKLALQMQLFKESTSSVYLNILNEASR